jgi:hypothetical protein
MRALPMPANNKMQRLSRIMDWITVYKSCLMSVSKTKSHFEGGRLQFPQEMAIRGMRAPVVR